MTYYFTILCGFLCEKPVIGRGCAGLGKPPAGRYGRWDGGGLLTGTGRTWCKGSRKALFLRFLCTKSSALSPRHRARSVPPQSESTSGAHPSHFHKSKRKRHPRRRFPLLPLFEGNPRPGISDCSFPRKTHRYPGGVFRQKFPFLFLQGNFRHVFPEGLPANTPNGTPEKIPISPSLPTSFPSAGRSLPCRRCWRKPSRSRFCPGSGQPSSSPARNPHRPCRNPFSPPG